MMGRVWLFVMACFWATAVTAQQEPAPDVTITFETTDAIPGQPLSLRVQVLVPTWMIKPVVFPSLEQPDIMVRLPDRATTSVSQKIGRETWAGVSRHYRITPMVAGQFAIPPQDMIVTWADPETNVPRRDVVRMAGVTFTGTLPDGGAALDPFIAADEITMTQELTGAEAPLAAGDSITRVVTATVHGAPPLFLPEMMQLAPVEGIRLYRGEPVVSEVSQRGKISGTRVETVTYLAQSGSDGMAEPIEMSWFNLTTGTIETVSVEGFSLMVDAPLARRPFEISLRALVWAAIGTVLVGLFWVFAGRRMAAQLAQARRVRRAAFRASDKWAYRQLRAAIDQRDLNLTLRALDVWADRRPKPDPRNDAGLSAALTNLGAARYGRKTPADGAAWHQLSAILRAVSTTGNQRQRGQILPPLNPGTHQH